jgi:hypothetical protein
VTSRRSTSMASAEVAKRSALDDAEMSIAPDAMQLDERAADEDADQDLYTRLKSLQRQHEFLDIQVTVSADWHRFRRYCTPPCNTITHALAEGIHHSIAIDRRNALCTQEEYIKEEQQNLKRELLRAQEEVKRIQAVPLVIGQFLEMVDQVLLGCTQFPILAQGVSVCSRSQPCGRAPCYQQAEPVCRPRVLKRILRVQTDLRHRRQHHRQQLLRAHPEHAEPGAAQAQQQRGAAPALQCARRHPATGGGFLHLAAVPVRAPRRHIPGK